jgi:type I restriction enzyme R subunit
VSTVGQIEKRTQIRIVALLRDRLGYEYLGDWTDRVGNRNIDAELLTAFLKQQGYDDTLISRANRSAKW